MASWIHLGQRACRRHSRSILGLLGCVMVALIVGLHAGPAPAQVTQATVTEILDGDQVYIQNRRVPVNSVAQQRQQVRTAAARAELRFNTNAVARLAQNSSLTVGDCAQLRQGTLLVNGPLNGCTTSTLAGVRGTIYTIEVDEANQTRIRVYEGEVLVSQRPATEAADPTDEPALTDPSLMNEAEPINLEESESGDPVLTSPDGLKQAFSTDRQGSKLPADRWLAQTPDEPMLEESLTETQPSIMDSDDASGEAVELSTEAPVAVQEGQQITIDAEASMATVSPLTAEDFINFLEGPLVQQFNPLPGIDDLTDVFGRLFPGIPLPSSFLPIPTPSLPFPFPF